MSNTPPAGAPNAPPAHDLITLLETTKYALCTSLDQTIGYITPDGRVTMLPNEAKLFDTQDSAHGAREEDDGLFLETVTDEAAFRARAPTWHDRALTPATLLGLVGLVADSVKNEHLGEELRRMQADGLSAETTVLFHAARALLRRLGHEDGQGRWVLGPDPRDAALARLSAMSDDERAEAASRYSVSYSGSEADIIARGGRIEGNEVVWANSERWPRRPKAAT